MADELEEPFEGDLVFNGINGVSGEYGQPPMPSQQLARLISGNPTAEDFQGFVAHQKHLSTLTSLSKRLDKVTDDQLALQEAAEEVELAELKFKSTFQEQIKSSPVKPGAGDPSRIEDVGWAVLFPAEMNPTLRENIKEALKPLLDLRQQQAGEKFQIYQGGKAYRPGERKDKFCERLNVGQGAADPTEMPFYVMLVGTPNDISYRFQYQLDVMRGVGRLDFGDNIQAYADYAQNVVAAESGQVTRSRSAAFFGTANPSDKATRLSARYLVQPLYENLQNAVMDNEIALNAPWEWLPPIVGEGQATKSTLTQLLGGQPELSPALLFTASHGMEFPAGHPYQMPFQGSLLCQDWPGPGSDIKRDYYFAAEDVASNANMLGMIAMLFACYGAGTPELDQFAMQAFKVREKIAPKGFTAALPQRMLQKGALAVIGHVERAWGYSFISPSGNVDNQAFVTALRMLMNGNPVGLATDPSFNLRYAGLSSDLNSDLEELKWDPAYLNDYELAHRWTANNDARSYVIIGDPAVRIPLATTEPAPVERPEPGIIINPEPTQQDESEEPVINEPPAESGEPDDVQPTVNTSSAPVIKPAAAQRVLITELSADDFGVAFGLGDQFSKLRESLRTFTDQLATSLSSAARDIVSLDIRTYVADDLEAVSKAIDTGQEITAKLQALTRVAFDGDMEVFVPKKSSGLDESLWKIHTLMVEEAQNNRAQFLKTMAELATNLLESLNIKP